MAVFYGDKTMARRTKTHVCSVPDCTAKRDAKAVMCHAHWFQVSKATRDRVWREYKKQAGSPDHMSAIWQAIMEARG